MTSSLAADVPPVVVDGGELAVVVDAQGVEVARDGLGEVGTDKSFVRGFFDGAERSSVGGIGDVGADATSNKGGAEIAVGITHSDTLLLDSESPLVGEQRQHRW